CYYRTLDGRAVRRSTFDVRSPESQGSDAKSRTSDVPVEGGLDWLYGIVRQRQVERREGSYVARLLAEGVDRIGKKIGEEAAEVIIAAKNRSPEELANEMADLWFHSLVLLADAGMEPADVYGVLAERHREKAAAPHIVGPSGD
ncbi:MAG: phosphoribosyl-ATP diphosphatase, partial [Chloroflexota bacterium]